MANRVTMSICGTEYILVAEEDAAYMEKIGNMVDAEMQKLMDSAHMSRDAAAVLAAALAGLFGILAALGLVIWYLCTIDSDGVAYMAPFVDSERPTIFRTLLRRPQPDEKFRPPEYDSPNRRRQR